MGNSLIRVEHFSIMKTVNTKTAKFMFWDTDSNRCHHTIRSVYYEKANAIIVVFDTTNMATFKALGFWISSIEEYIHTCKKLVYLVGTKVDNTKDRVTT